ncbi:alanine racemase [Clostridiaceae bacterium M8S5]|nr:alanine racemase [Clostridiaceae bacterium M8S5]
MSNLFRDTILEVNIDNLEYNIKEIKKLIGEDVAIAAVIKANGYGHGGAFLAPIIIKSGADMIAVATLTEALELRKNNFTDDILIMGYTPDNVLEHTVKHDIIQTIFSLNQALLLDKVAYNYNKQAKIHIKYDTGFNRLGFRDCTCSIDEIEQIYNLKHISPEGIFSHFALKNKSTDSIQYNKFVNAINELKKRGIIFKYKHICDSIAAVDYPEYRLNMIRPGAIIYGLKSYENDSLKLKQVMTFKTKISHIKLVSKGEGVSYGYRWIAKKDSIIGTLPFGYADGYPRNMKDKGYVTIHNQKAPIIGVICMDQCMVDLTHVPNVKIGDEVIIYGDGKNNTMSIQEASELAETNKNEIVARITRRTPRVYIKSNNIIKIVDYLLD